MWLRQENLVWYIKIILLLFMPWNSFSQGINNNWLTGANCGTGRAECGNSKTDFYSGFPDTLHSSISMSFLDCNANISDSSGNLLFYTNGVWIANANNDTMVNGDSLNPGFYTYLEPNGLRVKQGNLILPLPGDTSIYYLFHETLFNDQSVGDLRVPEIFYSVIDMRLDSGLGAVVQKNVTLLSDTLTIGAITSCKHANGRDWWIVFHKSKGRRYYKYLLTPSGLQGPFMQDIGYSIAPDDWIWQSCFSPDGSKFASVMARDTMDVMDFDRCTGMFSNATSLCINDSAAGRGVAFSPSSQVMYVSSMNYVYQYHFYSASVESSKQLIILFDGYADINAPYYTGFYLSQLANDNKIYMNTGNGSKWFTVVNDPDSIGYKCNILQHSFRLPTYNGFTIPNFPNYFLGAEAGSVCDSLSRPVYQDGGAAVERHMSQVWPISDTGYETQMIKKMDRASQRFTFKEIMDARSKIILNENEMNLKNRNQRK